VRGSLQRRRAFAWTTGLAVVAILSVFTVGAQAIAPVVISSPTVKGIFMEGETVEATSGKWTGEPPFTYEYDWQRCNNGGGDCRLIGVPKGQTYTLTAADIGHRIRTWVSATGLDCTDSGTNGFRICRVATGQGPSELSPVIDANPTFLPRSTASPTISGTVEEGSTLHAQDGGWTGIEPITTARQWERCDAAGSGCTAIPGATAATHVLGVLDVAKTLRLVVTARNARGSSSPVASAVTGVVAPYLPRPGRTTINASRVELPHRFVIDRVVFAPAQIRGLGTVVARVRVSDTRGFRVRGALVGIVSVPAGLVSPARQAATGSDGWATLRLRPTARVVFRRGGSIQLLFRARKADDSGVAAQRRASLRLAAPRR
jgi:hypothetical protein